MNIYFKVSILKEYIIIITYGSNICTINNNIKIKNKTTYLSKNNFIFCLLDKHYFSRKMVIKIF